MSRPTSFLPEWLPTPANRRYRRRLGALRATIRDLVTERRAAGPPADPSAPSADDLLGTLVAAAKLGALDDEELVDNAVTFLFAGHETSALGLTYALYCLARRPAFQDRIRSEIAPLHGDPTPADLRECPADRGGRRGAPPVSPVHSFFREPTEPIALGEYRIPSGVVLTLAPWSVHRDGRWWNAPETYRPERWLRETEDGGVVHGDDRSGPAVGNTPNTPSSRSVGAATLHRDALRATGTPARGRDDSPSGAAGTRDGGTVAAGEREHPTGRTGTRADPHARPSRSRVARPRRAVQD